MNNTSVLEYLRDYVSQPRLLALTELDSAERDILPESWREVLSLEGLARVKKVLEYWADFANEFEQLIQYLKSNLETVDLLHHGKGYSLLYGVRAAKSRRVLYYDARNPNARTVSPAVSALWSRLPPELLRFYDFHDGWCYLASGGMGLSPGESCFVLSEEDWGILETIDPPRVNLHQTVVIFASGMGGYVCLDLSREPAACVLWWSSEAPELDLDLWPILDSWTTIGLDA